MIGRSLGLGPCQQQTDFGEIARAARALLYDGSQRRQFYGRKGEILGMYGRVCAGRSEVAETIFGPPQNPARGEILLDGKLRDCGSSHDALSKVALACQRP